MKIEITSQEISVAVHALRVAAENFEKDAKVCREESQRGMGESYSRLAEQFDRQVSESRELASKLEEVA